MKEHTPTRISVLSTSYRHQLRTTAVGMQCVKGNQVPTLPLVQGDLEHLTDESLLLVSYV